MMGRVMRSARRDAIHSATAKVNNNTTSIAPSNCLIGAKALIAGGACAAHQQIVITEWCAVVETNSGFRRSGIPVRQIQAIDPGLPPQTGGGRDRPAIAIE